MHLSSLESHLYIPIREGSTNKFDMVNIPMETNQGTFLKGDPYAFPFFGKIGIPLMATLNIPGLSVGLPIWLWSTLNIPDVIESFEINA